MAKKRYSTILTAVLACALVAALAIPLSLALALSVCNPSFSFQGRSVQSCKENYVLDGNQYWKGRMVTKVLSGSAIDKLGWHSWTDTRFCNGQAVDWYDYGSSYGYDTTFWASTSASHPVEPCDGTNESRVYGNHYWEESGSSTTEAWSLWRPLP